MESFLIYIGKVAIGAGAFYLAFLLLFQNQKHFVFNRIYLPISMLLSFIIPLFTFTTVKYIEASGVEPNSFAYLANTTIEIPEKRIVFEWYHYLFGFYLAGISGFLFHLFLGHLKAIQIIRKSQKKRLFETDVNITKKDVHPFSFFNKIVLSGKTLNSKNLEIIVKHESIHVKEKHTYDILFTEILFMLQWFNPFAWLIKDAVKNNLEYKTDHIIVQRFNPQNYQMAMVALADKKGVAPFLTALNGSQLKNRIIMMKKKTKNKYTLLKQMVVLPLVAVLVMGLSAREVTTKIIEPENLQSENAVENWRNSFDEDFTNQILRDGVFVLQDYGENAPIIFLNGKKVNEKIIINETDVKSVNVLAEESALERFGDEGKNGAMFFNTEKEFEWPNPIKNLIVNVDGKNVSHENPDLKKYDTSKGFDSGKIIDALKIDGNKVESVVLNFNKEDFATLYVLTSDYAPGTNDEFDKVIFSEEKLQTQQRPENTLYAIDGELKSKDEVANLGDYSFESLTIISDEHATKKYGEKVKDATVMDFKTGESNVKVISDVSLKEFEVKGKVTDSSGEPVAGATILVKGANQGAITNLNGEYRLNLRNDNATLIFWMVDYLKQEIKVSGKSEINVELVPDNTPYTHSLLITNNKSPQSNKDLQGEEVLYNVEQMPEFPGGESALKKYISHSIRYPKVALEKGIQGTVYVTFIITKDGKVIDPKVSRGVDPSLDEEAVRVAGSLPKWKPGKQEGKTVNTYYTVPVKFKPTLEQIREYSKVGWDGKPLKNNSSDYSQENLKKEQIKIKGDGSEGEPLYVVDGEERDSISNLDPTNIERIDVLKGESATSVYGKKAINGAIVIKTKSANRVNPDKKTKLDETNVIGYRQKNAKEEQVKVRLNSDDFEDEPLYIVDGRSYKSMEEANIDPEDIASITVRKDESATALYGEKAKNGAIEITLKKAGKLTQNEIPVILNGKPIKQKLNEIDRDLIEHIKKINPEEATKKYGEFGKLGVLEITSRNVYTDKVKVKSSDEITTELELRKFIAEKIKYPVEAQKKGQEGTVLINVKIENKTWKVSQASGSLKDKIDLDEVVVIGYGNENVKETKSEKKVDYPYLIEEVRRVIHLSPAINIPEFEGKSVSIAVKFMLQ